MSKTQFPSGIILNIKFVIYGNRIIKKNKFSTCHFDFSQADEMLIPLPIATDGNISDKREKRRLKPIKNTMYKMIDQPDFSFKKKYKNIIPINTIKNKKAHIMNFKSCMDHLKRFLILFSSRITAL
jgi:hypothetical protein